MTLILNSATHRTYNIEEIKTRFVTPIMLDQFRLYRNKRGPIGIVTWAEVDEDISRSLKSGEPLRDPRHVKSGPDIWLLEFIAPFGHVRAITRDLRDNIFAGRRINAIRNRERNTRSSTLMGRAKVSKGIVEERERATVAK